MRRKGETRFVSNEKREREERTHKNKNKVRFYMVDVSSRKDRN
jgi:hypothetical protein